MDRDILVALGVAALFARGAVTGAGVANVVAIINTEIKTPEFRTAPDLPTDRVGYTRVGSHYAPVAEFTPSQAPGTQCIVVGGVATVSLECFPKEGAQ